MEKIKKCPHIEVEEETETQGWYAGKLYCIDCMPEEFFTEGY